MTTHVKLMALLTGLFLTLSASAAQTIVRINGGNEACTNFIAASQDVGDVCLSTDGTDNFFVEYTTASGWGLDEVHSWLGDNLTDMPTDSKGNPIPGQFPYSSGGLNGTNNYVFTVPFGDVGLDPDALSGDVTWYLAAHGVVSNSTTETAWADGDIIVGERNVPIFSVTITAPVAVPLDIRPGSCPNPLNCKARGVLPVAIAGTVDLDVTQIDPLSIRLAGVAPLRSGIEDVTTPFEPFTGKQDCDIDCNTVSPDGFPDLTLKFDLQEVIAALGNSVQDGACLVVELTGNLREEAGGTAIVGEDVMRILCKAGKK